MTRIDESVRIEPADLAPVEEWLEDLRQRVDGLERASRSALGAKEWTRLRGAVKEALSTERASEVLDEFLGRVGVRQSGGAFAASAARDLRSRILRHRHELTIESYTHQLRPPPAIEF